MTDTTRTRTRRASAPDAAALAGSRAASVAGMASLSASQACKAQPAAAPVQGAPVEVKGTPMAVGLHQRAQSMRVESRAAAAASSFAASLAVRPSAALGASAPGRSASATHTGRPPSSALIFKPAPAPPQMPFPSSARFESVPAPPLAAFLSTPSGVAAASLLQRAHSDLLANCTGKPGAPRVAPGSGGVKLLAAMRSGATTSAALPSSSVVLVRASALRVQSSAVQADVLRVVNWLNATVGGLPHSPDSSGTPRILADDELLYVMVGSTTATGKGKQHVQAAAVVRHISSAYRIEAEVANRAAALASNGRWGPAAHHSRTASSPPARASIVAASSPKNPAAAAGALPASQNSDLLATQPMDDDSDDDEIFDPFANANAVPAAASSALPAAAHAETASAPDKPLIAGPAVSPVCVTDFLSPRLSSSIDSESSSNRKRSPAPMANDASPPAAKRARRSNSTGAALSIASLTHSASTPSHATMLPPAGLPVPSSSAAATAVPATAVPATAVPAAASALSSVIPASSLMMSSPRATSVGLLSPRLTSSSPLSPSLLSPSSQSRPLLSSPIPRASSSSIVPAAARSSSVVPATTVLRTSSGLSDSDSDAEGEARRYPARVGVDKIAVDARCRGRGVAMQLLEYVRWHAAEWSKPVAAAGVAFSPRAAGASASLPTPVPRAEFAFCEPLDAGCRLAQRFCQAHRFLTFK